MSSGGGQTEVVLANSLWGQKDIGFRSPFLKTCRSQYGALLSQVDFENAPQAALDINAWASKATGGKIENLYPANGIDKSTRLVLASAAYFKASWQFPFDKAKTQSAPFHRAQGKAQEVPMMEMQTLLTYGESKTLQAVELPYRSRELSMIVVLPKRANGLAELEESLNEGQMTQILSWVKPQEVRVILPRFKFDSEFGLAGALQELGMNDAFSAGIADFTGIADGELFVGAVRQKSHVEVNEEGTEAAAAAAVEVRDSAMPKGSPEPFLFRADHPFIFLIRHNPTGAILFMGRVARP